LPERLAQEFARLPRTLAADPRFAKHEGAVAQINRDWPAAARAYRRASEFEPFNGAVLNRLRMVLRAMGENTEAERVNQRFTASQDARKQARAVYEELSSLKTLGLEPQIDLYHRLAMLREEMGRFDEARAWHRLVLRDAPDDVVSLAALEQLKYHEPGDGQAPPGPAVIFSD